MSLREHKRCAYERWRRERWLWFKNRRLVSLYFNRHKEYDSIMPIKSIVPDKLEIKINLWKKIFNWFKKLFIK